MGKAARKKRQRRTVKPAPPPGRRLPQRGLLFTIALFWVAAVALGLIAWRTSPDSGADSAAGAPAAVDRGPVPGVATGPAPWPAEQDDLPRRLRAADVPFSTMEGTAVHIHPRLRVLVDGDEVEVPTDIGISYVEQAMAALHTHDTEGTIHVESPVVRNFTLGQFFDTWGVRLTRTCVGGYCASDDKRLRALVDGRQAANPRSIQLTDGQDIVLAFGTSAESEG